MTSKRRRRVKLLELFRIKILGVSILITLLINFCLYLFYFDQSMAGQTLSPHSEGSDQAQSHHSKGVDQDLGVDQAPSHHSEGDEKDGVQTIGDPVPVIVWWDPVAGQTDQDIQCGSRSCHVTVDRARWQEQEVMMLSFYGSSLSVHELPVPRGEGHLWALFHDESPKNMDFLFSHQAVMELFNYTSTFRTTSHLPFPTQWLNDVRDLTSDRYTVPVQTKSEVRRTQDLAPVVYVQSDCRVPSDRDQLVTVLQRYVAVDSYGPCLHNRDFPNRSLSFQHNMSPMTSEDFYRFLAPYKFAVAVENAVCPSYITEKLWRPLQLGVVPIVFGAPDIKEFLPSNHCALVVDDFPSVEKLAQAIQYYDTHDAEYSKLLHFKQSGVTNPALLKHLEKRWATPHYRSEIVDDYQCMLCDRLHEAIAARQAGRPIPPSVASKDHYGCPKPGKFNTEGHYLAEVSGHWDFPLKHSKATACLMRTLIDSGSSLSLEAFDQKVWQLQDNFQQKCQQYF
ncbi:GDP-fucose protein O-fucosyltransferase 3-like isoform X2 [Babylonia areolata]|uniref:GDP-fucose protein O-fucosyltransferase 3-like isoform X2 n=1 Tax=Babylonia areolata TaxID=304850 RepID=UPI003FD45353